MAYVDPSMGAPDPADVSAAMVAPRKPVIGNAFGEYSKWHKAYVGGSFIPFLSMGSTTQRARSTILRGGYAESPLFDTKRGLSGINYGLKESLHPSSWMDQLKKASYGSRTLATKFPQSYTRYDSTTIFNSAKAHEGAWSPFQLSPSINSIGHAIPGMKGQDLFTRGTSAMLGASSTMFRMSQAEQLSEQMAGGVAGTIAQSNPLYSGALETGGFIPQTGQEAAYALLGANSGVVSSRVAGMYAGAKAGFSGGTVPEEVLSAARATSAGGARFAASAERATALASDVSEAGGVLGYASKAYAAGGLSEGAGALLSGGGLTASTFALDAIPGVGEVAMVAQTAMLARGVSKLLKGGIQSGIHFAEDGIKSYKGTIDKPVFGMGFRDTDASITARQRGVQAIQNSRLNARSWLGSESSSMWHHFG